MPELIDSHAHVNFPAYDEDREVVLRRALDSQIWVVNVGSSLETSRSAVELAERYAEGVYAVIGLHPIHTAAAYSVPDELESGVSAEEEMDYDAYRKLAKNDKTLAIGEIGLDYHHFNDGDDIEGLKKKQREILIKFIALANEVGKPIMIHCWDAYDDLLEILREHPVAARGIVHSFVGGFRTAKKFIELGYYIGLNGVVTYTPDFDRLIKEVPLEKMVVETDSPYLTPGAKKKGEPVLARRNEPCLVMYVAEHIARVKNLTFAEVAAQTTANAQKVLKI